ncbi:MAG: DUF1800 domain-containing protein [Bacteroidia bacterium]|nr:DUF1800 domain-containing protein [Bacteroidia bacterium]
MQPLPETQHIQQINHVFLRGGFGIPLSEMEKTYVLTVPEAVKQLFSQSSDYEPLHLIRFKSGQQRKGKKMDREERKEFRQDQREQLQQLNVQWLRQLSQSKMQLREKITLFWHGHFACRVDNPAAAQHLNNVVRQYGMGSFENLLLEVSKSPAMLIFLNNRQNRKAHPNENFARELLELFTLGRGNYSENDVKEAARAFTGWNFDEEGQFELRERQHDHGNKTFLGKSGDLGGEDIIKIVLEKKQCARFLAGKLYAFFVSPQADAEKIGQIATWLYDSGYKIGETVSRVFNSEWFYRPEIMGAKIKSPIELLAGTFRLLDLDTELDCKPLLRIQRGLGQVLFQPPNVAGWPGDHAWIDSSTLLIRLKLAGILMGLEFPEMRMKGEPEDDFDRWQKNLADKLDLKYNWARALKPLPASLEAQWQWLAPRVLQQGSQQSRFVLDFLGQVTGEEQQKRLIWRLLSLPEWQVC